MAPSIEAAMQTALACVCEALIASERPVCVCYATIGDPMAAVCCECDAGKVGEVSIRLERVYEADPITLEQITRVRPCKVGVTAADFVVTLYRCFPTLTDTGEVPDHEDQAEAATEMNLDTALLWRAISCCAGLRVSILEIAVGEDPIGGCSELNLRFAVEVNAGAVS